MPVDKKALSVQRIRARIKEVGMTPNAVAERMGERSKLNSYIRGKQRTMGQESWRKLSQILRREVGYLMGVSDDARDIGASPNWSAEDIESDRDIVHESTSTNVRVLDTTPLKDVENNPQVGEEIPLRGVEVASRFVVRIAPVKGACEAGVPRPINWFEGITMGEVATVLERDEDEEGVELFAYQMHEDTSMELAGIPSGSFIVCVDPFKDGVEMEITTGDKVVVETIIEHPGRFMRELACYEVHYFRNRVEFRPRSSNPRYENMSLPADHDFRRGNPRIVGLYVGPGGVYEAPRPRRRTI